MMVLNLCCTFRNEGVIRSKGIRGIRLKFVTIYSLACHSFIMLLLS